MRPDRRAEDFLAGIDEAVAGALDKLAGEGRRLPCGPGCKWCCYLPVRATVPEAMLVADWLKTRLTPEGLFDLKRRLAGWIRWNRDELPRHITGVDVSRAYLTYGPPCPFLSGGLCEIYPVRPMGCRVHFSFDAAKCRPDAPAPSIFDPPPLVQDVLDAARPLCLGYRMDLQDAGIDFEGALRLLPETLLDNCL